MAGKLPGNVTRAEVSRPAGTFPAPDTPPEPLLVVLGGFLFRYRNALFPLALPLVLLPGPRLFASNLAAAAIGFTLCMMGQGVRALTIALAYIIRGGRDRRVYAEGLVTEGLYGHVRNPMYVGNLLLISGVAVSANSWGCVAVVVPLFALCYHAITRAEEDYLSRRFGPGYQAYCAEVPRLIPRLTGLGRTLSGAQLHWRRLLVREYGTLAGWPVRWMLVVTWRIWADGELQEHPGLPWVFGATTGLLACFYLVVRALKKQRVLVAD